MELASPSPIKIVVPTKTGVVKPLPPGAVPITVIGNVSAWRAAALIVSEGSNGDSFTLAEFQTGVVKDQLGNSKKVPKDLQNAGANSLLWP